MYIAHDPVSCSHVLYTTNIQENKLHLIKSRFRQMCFKTFFKAPIYLQSVIDLSKAFHSFSVVILNVWSPKHSSLLWGTANWLETEECNVQTLVLSWSIYLSYIVEPDHSRHDIQEPPPWNDFSSSWGASKDFSTRVRWSNFFVPSTTRGSRTVEWEVQS